MKTKDLGNIGELITTAKFIELGCNVFTSYADNSPIDFIIEYQGCLKKIQVKTTASIQDNKMFWRLDKTRMNSISKICYNKEDFDFFVLYCHENQYIGIISMEEVDQNTITIRTVPAKNNQTKGIRMAKDYALNDLSKFNFIMGE